MPALIISTVEGERKIERRITFKPGHSLRHILDNTDLRVRAGCRGTGACGLCRVRIAAGDAGEPTENERIFLKSPELAQKIRLACQVMPEHDLQVEILSKAPKSAWRTYRAREECSFVLPLHHGKIAARHITARRYSYGAAVDLGTTHIKISLYELSACKWLTGRYGLNPQLEYGADVMTRLMAAAESAEAAATLKQQLVGAIGEALLDMAGREGINLQQVVRLVVVGNTAMLALLSGRNYSLLLQPAYWMKALDCLPLAEETKEWAVSWAINEQAEIEVMPPLAGFVGSDLLAGVMATKLNKQSPGTLFIDFGTNSELALWDGRELWVTSAAGGPAFEGSGISCGLPAEPGAVYQVSLHGDAMGDVLSDVPGDAVGDAPGDASVDALGDSSGDALGDALDYAVIAGEKPRGICGSGLVDLIATLLRLKKLDRMGRFPPDTPAAGILVIDGERDISLTKSDVDVFQRAKAAIGTGIRVLLAKAGLNYKDISCLYIAGAFGSYLNVVNAQQIGLLPAIEPALVKLCGNTALLGCEGALLSTETAEQLKSYAVEAKLINLSEYPDFDDIFMDNLFLKPLSED